MHGPEQLKFVAIQKLWLITTLQTKKISDHHLEWVGCIELNLGESANLFKKAGYLKAETAVRMLLEQVVRAKVSDQHAKAAGIDYKRVKSYVRAIIKKFEDSAN